MSDTFKFLDNKDGKAQDFLKGKMKTVANASEGVIPAGDAYKKYGEMPGTKSDTPTVSTGGGGSGDLRTRYEAKFGTKANDDLANANDAASANAIYNNIKSLESDEYWQGQDLTNLMKQAGHQEHSVNIGNYSKDGGLSVNASISDGIDFSNIQSQLDDKGWNGEKNNSIGQLGSALLAAGGSGGSEDKPVAEPEKAPERTPIKHSLEIQQAKERVRTYEDDILSGKTSNDIYGQQNANKNIVDRVNEKYNLDLNKGIEGIGIPQSANEPTEVATDSFLDSKKEDIKKQYQFQPKGAN